MNNVLLDKGIILPSGEISKDKVNLVTGAITQPFAEMVRPFCAEPYRGCAMTLFLYREKPSEKHRDGKQVSSLRATTRIEGR